MTTLQKLVSDFLSNREKGANFLGLGFYDDAFHYMDLNKEIREMAFKNNLELDLIRELKKAGVLI